MPERQFGNVAPDSAAVARGLGATISLLRPRAVHDSDGEVRRHPAARRDVPEYDDIYYGLGHTI